MLICEKCMASEAFVNYAVPEQVAPGKQTEWNLCQDCMVPMWSEMKLNHPTSMSYLCAVFSLPRHHKDIREPGEMA